MYFKATDEGPTIKVCNTNKFSLKSVLILFPNIVSYDIVVFYLWHPCYHTFQNQRPRWIILCEYLVDEFYYLKLN